MNISQEHLVQRCRSGDGEAWCEFVGRFSGRIYGIARRGFRLEGHDAEDVCQDVFVRAYEHMNELRNDEAIRQWIEQITRRVCIDLVKARSREQLTDEGPELREPEITLARIDDTLSLQDSLQELPDDFREVLDRFFCLDESYETIAEALALPQGTIASRISRGLVKLRARLEETDFEGRGSGSGFGDGQPSATEPKHPPTSDLMRADSRRAGSPIPDRSSRVL
jgi:RNA polymerase sigma-70 factor (ECF subfamily)